MAGAGGFIHGSDPFAVPVAARSPGRRLRGRLPAPVTLWTAYDAGGAPVGLTVSSLLVADGEPGQVLGLLDAEAALWPAIEAGGRWAVSLLHDAEQQLADVFAGLLPAPGGPFAAGQWTTTEYGPVPAGDGRAWAGCVRADVRECGWALLVTGVLAALHLPEGDAAPLVHVRGRYRRLA